LTATVRLAVPLPERICSFSTIRMPAVSMRTVFGAGFCGIVRPRRIPSVPPTAAFSIVVAPAAPSVPPQGPVTTPEDVTVVAVIVRRG
jgi:hypothetical protein